MSGNLSETLGFDFLSNFLNALLNFLPSRASASENSPTRSASGSSSSISVLVRNAILLVFFSCLSSRSSQKLAETQSVRPPAVDLYLVLLQSQSPSLQTSLVEILRFFLPAFHWSSYHQEQKKCWQCLLSAYGIMIQFAPQSFSNFQTE